ncbi:hypothetical protein [Nakamurella endophytica]|nr:hypothetical protein [Nakamurella endophytica]
MPPLVLWLWANVLWSEQDMLVGSTQSFIHAARRAGWDDDQIHHILGIDFLGIGEHITVPQYETRLREDMQRLRSRRNEALKYAPPDLLREG